MDQVGLGVQQLAQRFEIAERDRVGGSLEELVALSLLVLGFFDSSATQVAGGLVLSADSGWLFRFYVNGEPPAP